MRTRSFGAFAFSASMIACAAAHGQCEAQWFTNVGKPGLDGPVWASTVFDDGEGNALYTAGSFNFFGNDYVGPLAKWDGKVWTNASPGNQPISALGTTSAGFNQPATLCAASYYVWVHKQGTPGYTLVQTEWYPKSAYSLVEFDRDGVGAEPRYLIAGGDFGLRVIDPYQPFVVAFWTSGGPGLVMSILATTDLPLPTLFVGGYGAGNIVQYDRIRGFLPLSTGTNGPVNALCIFDDGSGPALFAGGDFTDAGGVAVHSIAKWDGESWSDVGGGVKGGLLAGVYSLSVFDDGNGEALFVGGNFDSAGGQPAANVARWDGANWSALGEGVTGDGATVLTMTPFKTGNKEFLYVGGWFDHAGGLPSNNIARWGCPQEKACYPDCDGTNSLDLFDFLCFVNQFNAGVPYSDCTQDGMYDLFDFLCFVNAFNAGCP